MTEIERLAYDLRSAQLELKDQRVIASTAVSMARFLARTVLGKDPDVVGLARQVLADDLLVDAHTPEGKTAWVLTFIADSIWETLRKDDGSLWNHIWTRVNDGTGRSADIVIQRSDGETPQQQKAAWQERTVMAESALAVAEATLRKAEPILRAVDSIVTARRLVEGAVDGSRGYALAEVDMALEDLEEAVKGDAP